ncbi:MAG TPA: VOC family protein [Candidatus Saccharimonadales bacterium]|nr:VOC family protein [Candidatus Saccharimonadales bacterium]
MFKKSQAFSSFSVDDLDKAKEFYGKTLGLDVKEWAGMGLKLKLATGGEVFIYPKGKGHVPASFTVLNFPVDDIDEAVAGLKEKGVKLEHYDGFNQDEDGVARSKSPQDGPSIAWFKDPAGNVLAILQ